MTAEEIISDYKNIEYLTDGKWYKLNALFPWCFKVTDCEDAANIVFLDAGGEHGVNGHFKIHDDKLHQKYFDSNEWIPLNAVRILAGDKQSAAGIVAVGEPIKINRED